MIIKNPYTNKLENHITDKTLQVIEKTLEIIKRENSALRYNEGKLEWTLVDWKSLSPLVKTLMYGKKKYTKNGVSGAHNWKKGMSKEKILDSLLRHVTSLCEGEEIDLESGETHIGAVLANAMFYSYYTQTKEGKEKVINE